MKNTDDHLHDLAISSFFRFEQGGEPKDIDDAIDLHRKALALRPPFHPSRDRSLTNLAIAIHTRFDEGGDLKDINEAVQLHRDALALRSPLHPACGSSLSNLANAVEARFKQHRDLKDINEAIELHRKALALRPPHHPSRAMSLNNLAIAILTKFEEEGDLKDIDEAVQLHREALALRPPPHPARGSTLNNLANALQKVFQHQGDSKDIDEAIELHREALALRPLPHPSHAISLNNLAVAISTRFEHGGELKDIDEVIQLHRDALALRPPPNLARSSSLNNLATAVQARFDQRGDLKDIDEAVQLLREASALRPPPHPARGSSLNNLANALQARFNHWGNSNDIDEAVQLHRESLALRPPPHPAHAISINNLANTVRARFDRREDPNDINEAIELHREALKFHAPPHPYHGGCLYNLATALQTRFKQQGNPKDIHEAIERHRDDLVLRASPHPHHGSILQGLAICLGSLYSHTNNGATLDNMAILFEKAVKYLSSSPLIRFRHACSWARTAAQYNHTSSLPAYNAAIELLPQVVALHLDVVSRQQILSTRDAVSLASGAATCAVGLSQFDLAVEFLEASRSVFWSQSLHLRTSLDDLTNIRPDLSSKLEELSTQLDQASFRDTLRNADQYKVISMEAEGARTRHLNEEWEEVVKSVRMVPGFVDFLQPKSIQKLQQAAVNGPIVVIHCGEASSNALVINSLGVKCVPLPELYISKAQILADMFIAASSSTSIDIEKLFKNHQHTMAHSGGQSLLSRLVGEREDSDNFSVDKQFCHILELLWHWMVHPIFRALDLKKSSRPPRLWWCPTGPFAFLPIHAAGIYGMEGTDCVSDYVVSSYTPTITALLDPPSPSHLAPKFKMTAVIQPYTPDFSPLPGAQKELEKIEARVPKQWLVSLGDTTPATVDTVLVHLRESSVVHFACHGVQDLEQPLHSGLALTDGRMNVSEIMRRPEDNKTLDIKKSMSLAFLSACETAKGDTITPDEAMHLAATLLFAGFRGVVATMWTMDDRDGPKVADIFYKHLFENCDPSSTPPVLPNLTRAAEALHLAVAKLREDPDIPFSRWVPFVHYGL
ncbi:CHAT domain-containing protein [Mycena epipterygia]|nr:CHAT domain-containing protein [Mycena epipterygia]